MPKTTDTAAESLLGNILFSNEPEVILKDAEPQTVRQLFGYLANASQKAGVTLSFGARDAKKLALKTVIQHTITMIDRLGEAVDPAPAKDIVTLATAFTNHDKDEQPNYSFHSKKSSWRVLLDKDGANTPIELPRGKAHWLTPYRLLECLGKVPNPKNRQKICSLISLFSMQDNRPFIVNGKTYFTNQLFGFYLGKTGVYTAYVNPMAVSFLASEFGWAPPLPQDGKWLSKHRAARAVFGSESPDEIKKLEEAADELLADPGQKITAAGDKKVSELVGYFASGNKDSTLFFHSDLIGFLKTRHDVAALLPKACDHFISEKAIVGNDSTLDSVQAMRPYYIRAVHQLILELLAKPILNLPDLITGKISPVASNECIGLYRKAGDEVRYFVDPRVRETYLKRSNILRRGKEIRDQEWTRESGKPQHLPPDKMNWMPPSKLAKQMKFRTSEEFKAVEAILRHLYDSGSPDVVWAINPPRTNYYANPEIIGTSITRELVLQKIREEAAISKSNGPGI